MALLQDSAPAFKVEWQGTLEATMSKIFHNLIVSTIKDDKPCVMLVTGKSGTGKSSIGLTITDGLYREEGMDFAQYVKQTVVMEITEFGTKVKAVLFEKDLKKCFVIIIDEARKTVSKDDWRSIVNRAVSMVNALSREVKPLAIIIITQSLRDIDTNTKDTIDYYVKCKRSLRHPTEATFYEFWVDDHNLDKPKLKKKIVKGVIIDGNKSRKVALYNVEFHRPRPEVWAAYKSISYDSKTKMLEQEFDTLAKSLASKYNVEALNRIEALANTLVSKPEMLRNFGIYKRKHWILNDDFCTTFDVTKDEKKQVEKLLFKDSKQKDSVEDGVDDGVPE